MVYPLIPCNGLLLEIGDVLTKFVLLTVVIVLDGCIWGCICICGCVCICVFVVVVTSTGLDWFVIVPLVCEDCCWICCWIIRWISEGDRLTVCEADVLAS